MKMRFNEAKPREFGRVSFLGVPMHSSPVTSIATCMKRHIVVTAGEDHTIRVWSYGGGSASALATLDICTTMFDEVTALALHPSGNYLMAAFASNV